jgi:hypothetical protein
MQNVREPPVVDRNNHEPRRGDRVLTRELSRPLGADTDRVRLLLDAVQEPLPGI